MHPSIHPSIPSSRAQSHARINSRDWRGRRCIHTVIPYIHTRYTRVVDSYSTDPRIVDKKKCMLDRFPVTYTRRGLSGSVVGHDTTHTYTYSSLFHFICIYCPRSKYVLHTLNTKRARPRHAGNQSLVHAFADATRRDRDWRRSSDDETGERTERTNERVRRRRRRLRRDATASRTRARLIGVGKIHSLAERVTEKSTREDSFIHSFIHSVR